MQMHPSQSKILDDIERHGCSVMHIAAEDDLPPFAFSMGIARVTNAPEVIVIGLKQPLAHRIVNEYNRRVRDGEVFAAGQRGTGFIEGFDVCFEPVHVSHYPEYLGANLWLHQGPEFEVLQIVYPTTAGLWPWDAAATDGFRAWQPRLSQPA